MKLKLMIAAIVTSLVLGGQNGMAAEKADAKTEMDGLFEKIQAKLKQGKKAEKDLTEEMKEFDALLARVIV